LTFAISRLLGCGGRDAVEVFDAGADPPTFRVSHPLDLAFAPDGGRPVVLSGSYHGAPVLLDPGAAVLDVATGGTPIAAPERATRAGLSPDGRFLVTCERGETVVRELGPSRPAAVLETPFGPGEPLPMPAVAPGGAHVALAANGELSLWDVGARRKLGALEVGGPPAGRGDAAGRHPRVVSLAFSPDGGRLAGEVLAPPPGRGDERYEVRVWDVASRRETCRVPRPRSRSPPTAGGSPRGRTTGRAARCAPSTRARGSGC
jgi:hypothetical protein